MDLEGGKCCRAQEEDLIRIVKVVLASTTGMPLVLSCFAQAKV